ncbi:MAG: glutaredoxin domain-containing protein [Paracoccaceae bacterium]
MFSLEWCEFSWSVRNLFAAADIAYHSVDLDGPHYRENDHGGAVRRALAKNTGALTIPQVFIAGRHIGGATETFDAFNDGRLRQMLVDVGRDLNADAVEDAYRFLPAWLHPRKPSAA